MGDVEGVERLIEETTRFYDARFSAAVADCGAEDASEPAAARSRPSAAALAAHVSAAADRRSGARAESAAGPRLDHPAEEQPH